MTANAITFGDATTQTSAASARSYTSTRTVILADQSFTNTAWGGCFAGISTITFTSAGRRIYASYRGAWTADAARDIHAIILIDGAVMGDHSVSPVRTTHVRHINSGSDYATIHMYVETSGSVAAGAHSFCMGAWTTGGTGFVSGPSSESKGIFEAGDGD